MPKDGDINKELGVFRNFCCGAEIAILAGDPFPGCPNHRKLPTHWKRIVDYRRLAGFFHVSMDRCVAFLLDGVRLESWEEGHLIRCNP
jgi:hypothetical protein